MFSSAPLNIQIGFWFGLALIILVTIRKLTDPRDKGIYSKIHSFFLIFFTSIMFFGLSPWMLDKAYRYINDPKYEAKIIDIKSQWKEDDEGNKRLWHYKVFKFTDKNGEEHTIDSSTSSTQKPTIGSITTITYADNTSQEFTIAGVMMTFSGFLMLHLLSLFPAYYILYVLSAKPNIIINYAIQFTARVLFPLGTLFFISGLVYKLYLSATGQEDIPLGAVIGMIFFLLFLIPMLFFLIEGAWGKKKKFDLPRF